MYNKNIKRLKTGVNMNIKNNLYDKFKCSADKCSYTCCREWKIAVDEETLKNWKKLESPLKDNKKIESHTMKKDGLRVIKLNENKICPFLEDSGLCKLVKKYGEEVLSHTCHIFPRQTLKFPDRTENTLVCCCPEVVDMLKQSGYQDVRLNITSKEDLLIRLREIFVDMVIKYPIEKAYLMFFYIIRQLYDMEDYEQVDLAQFLNKEVIDELEKAVELVKNDFEAAFNEQNEIFLDISDNYMKEKIYADFLEKLVNVSLQIEQDGLNDKENKWSLFLREYEKYEELMKKVIITDIYNNMVIPDADLESVAVKVSWSALEYSAMRFALFLIYLNNQKLDYDELRKCIVIISRMTGYDEEDIYEYLGNCFNDVVFEWPYMSLILSK